MLQKYLFNILISIDQFFNALFFGDPDETISSRCGKRRSTCRFCKWLCRHLDAIDKNHCSDAVEKDEGDQAL
jgi:hypothetical protein